ncbi:flagellar biosynthesis protein FlhF [Paenibacillus radicis (ex Gao et al. 2016)]|uniref:Flagellar biosynthesis protein FlhF n=1 Tax=Paenibacillus radicis (ex Gao et al. 2016) TaxID=1737354 RepID=A0A917HIY5_9BACL|nr:flagellar biosynthesis protein FlhF [Paenibacillus radicis (ex Gao et al. 2016)]GGG80660.1 flagellar biosynthesis protein FlhF [Paenibacillus radicis (ex Gao et al. 2016)]
MRVKRYVVNDLPEALPMIRSELGKDAVILNTKEVRIGGFMGMFRKKRMEVIAAIESNAPPPKPQSSSKQAADFEAVMTAINETVQQRSAVAAATARPSSQPATAATAVLEPQQPPSQALSRINDELLDEIRVIKQSLLQLSVRKLGQDMPAALEALYERLTDQEVEPELIKRLLDEVEQKLHEQQLPLEAQSVWTVAGLILNGWMAPMSGGQISEEARIVHFVGPTGVGKTTTIAKLAAEQTIKRGRQVGFITSDTYRIAAVDQLRTYANILNVPIEVVFSPMDLPKAFKALENRELIYMDTAGRNFRNELHVSEVNSLLQTNEISETILVLSLTGKTRDMLTVAENFSKYGVRKALFTKLDETSVFGAILNLAMNYQLTPTYVAKGQTVPDDIAPFNLEAYVNELLGAPADE